ncbi:MAG: DUF3800 domain-containing protein [Salinibacterium sp.]|nr:DUF3800 domain-containing protein [Salinibacterium sp.]
MLLAYIDEIGEPGAFIAKDHPRFRTSPAFGYAGFVIPEENARAFGAIFTHEKRTVFRAEFEAAGSPAQWERKGADMFRTLTPTKYPQHIRVYRGLVSKLRKMGGFLFYYADEKELGTEKQTRMDPVERETRAMQETLNRLCMHADKKSSRLMVMIDQINERTRAERIPNMYGHILSRASDREEMKRIIEPPMHVDSILSANIQFADWTAAVVTRAIENQVIRDSQYGWIPERFDSLTGAFTWDSKLHLWRRSVPDFNHSGLFRRERPLFPQVAGQRVGDQLGLDQIRKVAAAAERAQKRPS